MKKLFSQSLLMLIIVLAISFKAQAWQYTVTNTNDIGAGSLRQNITDALNNTGGTATGGVAGSPHTIIFNIPGPAPFVINQTNGNFNMYAADITIDATTQPGWAPIFNPIVVLRGTGGGESFQMNGTRMTARGFIFQNFQYGINVNNNTGGNIIQNCWFGVNSAGNATAGNTISEFGIYIKNGCPNFLVGSTTVLDNTTRCVISGCNRSGIYMESAGTGNIVSNCYIGTDISGTIGLGNGVNEPQNHHGIDINNTASASVLNSVISSNIGAGIEIRANSPNAVITGNKIGTDFTGNFPLGNRAVGMRIRNCNGHTIGGTTAALRNIISANGSSTIPNGSALPTQYDWYNMCGIYMEDVSNSSIIGNYIGTSVNGNTTTALIANDLGNFYTGIKIIAWGSGSRNNTIGGATSSHRNVVGGNGHRGFAINPAFPGHGIQFQTNQLNRNEDNYVYNNYVGIGENGTSNIGNKQDGVSLLGSITRIYIGGNGLGNVLSNNSFGVFIQDNCTLNYVMGNYIGTDASGTNAAPNLFSGVQIQWGSYGNYIGRANVGEGNVISGNSAVPGISLRLGGGTNTWNNLIYNNIIGLQPDGVTPLASTNSEGILIDGASYGNIIGGSAVNQRNIIAGNSRNGIFMNNGDNNIIYGNNIGLDINGNIRANQINGISLTNGSSGNIIGAVGQRNFISGNGSNGVSLDSSPGNIIRSNYIGTTTTGGAAFPNGGAGISMLNVAGTSVLTTIVDGNLISANLNVGIYQNASDYSVITGNTVGLNAAGNAAFPNGGVGMLFTNGSDNNVIGGAAGVTTRNIISSHASHGIYFDLGSNNNSIFGNYIGLGSDGTTAFGNGGNGISILGCLGTTIGGAAANQGNVISSNGFVALTASGISFSGGSNNTTIIGNIIGLNSTGLVARGNSDFGIWGFNNAAGPTTIMANVIAANGFGTNTGSGIFLGDCPNSIVRSNVSGLNIAAAAVPNRLHGLHLAGTTVAIVGGTVANQRNVLSGNTQYGLVIEGSSGNTVQGNSVGTDIAGTANLGNGFGGINIIAGATMNIIGGVAAGESNNIGYNVGNGINVDGATTVNNSIHRNSIYCNTLRGIVLSNGGNNNYTTPTFAPAGADITVTAAAGSYIEVFTLDGCFDCGIDPNSNKLQGRTLVFSGASPFTFTPVVGTMYTATASVANATAGHNTSEFSSCYVLCINAAAPTSITISSGKEICSSFAGNITLTAVGGSADPVEWYSSSCGGTLEFTGNPYVITVPALGVNRYYVRRTNGCGNSACIIDSITVHALPTDPTSASAATPAFCSGATGNIDVTSIGGSGERLVWYRDGCGSGTSIGSGTPLSISIPSNTADYFVRWESDACTASNCAQTTITINPVPSTSITGSGTICQDSIRNFSSSASANTFTWSFVTSGTGLITAGQGTNSITLDAGSANGTLTLTETTALSCSTIVSLPIVVQTPGGTTALAGSDNTLCVSSATLAANNTSGTWSVYNGSGIFAPDNFTFNASVSGLSNGQNSFIWTTLGTCGFVSRDTVNFNVGASGLIADATTPQDTACFGVSKDIQVVVSGTGSGNYTYEWTSSDNSFTQTTTSSMVSVKPSSESTLYYLTIIDNQNTGCNAGDTVTVFAVSDQALIVPNLVTPNGDDFNDYLEIRDENQRSILPGSYIEVMNRWGDRVYKHSSYDNTWNPNNLSDGIYYYFIDAGCGNKKYKGWVQIVH